MPVPSAKALEQSVFAANRAAGHLALSVKWHAGATRRKRIHEDGPLRVRCPGHPAPELEAVIVNTAGGMAGGDRFSLDVTVGRDAGLVLTTAAAEKVYRALDVDTSLAVNLAVADGAQLAWLPQETILFDRARLKRTIDVELSGDARLLLLEAMVFGRSGMGESVNEGLLFDRWRIRRNGSLLHAETVRLDGAIAQQLAQPAIAKSGIALATIVMTPADDAIVATVRGLADKYRGEVGASAWNGLAMLRLVAPGGATLRHDLIAILTAIRGTALPRLWLN